MEPSQPQETVGLASAATRAVCSSDSVARSFSSHAMFAAQARLGAACNQ